VVEPADPDPLFAARDVISAADTPHSRSHMPTHPVSR
jgi:hypothetical protein